MPVERLLKPAAVALAFALSGAWSASLMNPFSPAEVKGGIFLLPLPFAFLSFLLPRPAKPARLLGLALAVPVWLVAYLTTLFVTGLIGNLIVGMCVGGAVGGLGVTLCAAAGRPRLLSPKHAISAAAIGAVAALSFVFSGRGESTHLLLGRRCAFAIWQAAVGTYLYTVCSRIKRDDPNSLSQGIEPQ